MVGRLVHPFTDLGRCLLLLDFREAVCILPPNPGRSTGKHGAKHGPGFYNGISTAEVDTLAAETCATAEVEFSQGGM